MVYSWRYNFYKTREDSHIFITFVLCQYGLANIFDYFNILMLALFNFKPILFDFIFF